jgi:uncharacterized membrane protein YcgQ (UPF0703/DUF1980 family)
MSKLFSRWLPCATLLVWSLVLLYFAEIPGGFGKSWLGWTHLFTGRIDAFRPGVFFAGIIMFLMAMVFVFFPANAACCDAANCGHPISRSALGKWLSFLVLVVPVTVAARYSPDGFSETAMNNRGVITDGTVIAERLQARAASRELNLPLPTKDSAPTTPTVMAKASTPAPGSQIPSAWPDAPSTPVGSPLAANATPQPAASKAAAPSAANDYLQRTPEGHIVAEVLDLLYAAQDNVLRKDFEGQTVELIGQLMPDATNNAKGNRFKAVRMFMTCCAADARPVATLVESAQPPSLPEMTWIKITGTATFPVENGRRTAVLKANRVEKTEPPAETMLY